jgi:hypothetical protein
MEALIDKTIAKIHTLENDVFITLSDKSVLHIEAVPGSEVIFFYNSDEARPVKDVALLFSVIKITQNE